MEEQRAFTHDVVNGLAYEAWLRTGSIPGDIADLVRADDEPELEIKGNPYHDPRNGRFTSGSGGADAPRGYRGMTRNGVGIIKPVGGGGVDRNGRPRPELFPPDPYALHSPKEMLDHYMSGSGDDRNYYFNKVDTSKVKLTDFEELNRLVKHGKPGIYPIDNAKGKYNGNYTDLGHSSAWATVGGLSLRTNGVLAIDQNKGYRFSGRISADDDRADFDKREGRSAVADALTTFGRQLPGRRFRVHIVGSKPIAFHGKKP